MYYLSIEDSKRLSKQLIPRMRETGVADELRGWNWHEPPLEPPYEVKLPVYEVASKYCPSGRDVYLRRTTQLDSTPGRAASAGVVYHSVVAQTVSEAKRLVYQYGPGEITRIADRLNVFVPEIKAPDDVSQQARMLARFEVERIIARLQEVLSRQPYIAADSLVASAVPVTCEHRLDGSFLGLSSLVSCDAASFGGTVVFDLKFGRKRDFHRLSTTGYALVMESLWDLPVDIGCTVYVDLRGRVPSISRELYAIDDELRQWFIDERDGKMRIIAEQTDPGVADACYEYCAFRSYCLGEDARERVSAEGE